MTLKESEFDVERDLVEPERLLEESGFEDVWEQFEDSLRSSKSAMAWLNENSRPNDKEENTTVWRLDALSMAIKHNPKPEFKVFPDHLEYAFLEENDQKLVIIAASLDPKEKESLIDVLRKHKTNIAWNITDIKGISPSYWPHKINLEEGEN